MSAYFAEKKKKKMEKEKKKKKRNKNGKHGSGKSFFSIEKKTLLQICSATLRC